ncbi:hypothetical protein ACFLXJ_04945 [Chloroflexota bacterium]
MKKTAVVSTTIRVPKMLEDYCRNANTYHHDNIKMFVVGDKKTPSEARQFCDRLFETYRIPVRYLGIEEQEKNLKDFPKLLEIIPYNSGCRKLLGMLIAYLEGYANLITVDDDNFATDQDFFGYHDIVGEEVELPLVESSSGWFNTCDYLIEENNIPFYYRGIPWSQRKVKKDPVTWHQTKLKVVANSGFWLGDPDIDASSRLFWPIRVTGMRPEVEPNFGLYPGTWCPFNNQSTAMAREILPAYFTPHNAKRFGDIWPAYVVCCIAGHLNHVVSYGFPFVRQIRNPHNYWTDIDDEKVGAQATEPLVDLLRSAKLVGNNYHDCLEELVSHMNSQSAMLEKYPQDQQEMLTDFIKNLGVWHEVFNSVKKRQSTTVD